jgi:DNA helicase-2/ATP-dependent DNA helicase PcrA
MTPTAEQLAIAAHPGGPALVVAGAGAAKTTSLLLLVRRLIQERRFAPSRILMTTFSKRGASDMGRRAVPLCVPHGVEYRTLNSVGYMLVRGQPGERPPTRPADWQLKRVVREELRRIERERGPDSADSLPREKDVIREYRLAKAALIWPEPWVAAHGAEFAGYAAWASARTREPLEPDTAKVIAECYQAIETTGRRPEDFGVQAGEDKPGPFARDIGNRWVTYDDQLAIPARSILRRAPEDAWIYPWYAAYWQVLCDEVQDNNIAQWVLVEYLARDLNLVVVGDDAQSIFRFRGAAPVLMREFLTRYPHARVYPLSTNFRSDQAILDVANKVLEHLPERLFRGRLTAGLLRPQVWPPTVLEWGSPGDEARGVISDVEAAIKDGTNPDEITILYRINAQSGPFEMECIRRGIHYKIAGSSFFSRGEIRAALGFVAVAMDEEDEEGFRYCFDVPTRYLGARFLEENTCLRAVRANSAANKLGRWRRGAEELVQVVAHVRRRLEERGVVEALRYVFETAGVRKHYREEGADDEDETDVDEACTVLLHCAGTLPGAAELVKFARDLSKTAHEDHEGATERTPRITLSTVHKAKGLEWDAVYVVGVVGGLFPFAEAPPEEERCLFYVAVTRPRRRLYVSRTTMGGDGRAAPLSSLLIEAGLVDQEAARAQDAERRTASIVARLEALDDEERGKFLRLLRDAAKGNPRLAAAVARLERRPEAEEPDFEGEVAAAQAMSSAAALADDLDDF